MAYELVRYPLSHLDRAVTESAVTFVSRDFQGLDLARASRDVKIGDRFGQDTEIVEGVQEGDLIATTQVALKVSRKRFRKPPRSATAPMMGESSATVMAVSATPLASSAGKERWTRTAMPTAL